MKIMKCQISIIFLLLFKNIYSSEIVIPFHSKLSDISKNEAPTNFLNYLLSNELYSEIQIGTPPQTLDFLIDFENYNTYVIKEQNPGKRYQRFFDNVSSTFTYLGNKMYFSDSDFSFAVNSSDIITIGETLKNYNYTFLHAVTIRDEKKLKYPGVIGFNLVQNDDPFHLKSGLVYQLKSKNIIDNYIFTLSFNENDFNGNIIIGKNIYEDFPTENFTSDYCIVTPEYQYHCGWNYMNVYLNYEMLDIKDVYIRPELGVIILNSNYKDIFKKLFFDEKIKNNKCYDLYSTFYCDKDVDIDIGELKFEIKRSGLKFNLNSKDLFIEYGNKLYFLIEFEGRVDRKTAKLGYPFLRKYDMIFNVDSRHIGFYNFKIKYEYKKPNENKEKHEDKNINDNNNDNNYNNEENKKLEKTDIIDNNKIKDGNNKKNENLNNKENNNTKKVIFILLLIFFIILVIYCIFTIFRKCERKRKGKLFEDLFL